MAVPSLEHIPPQPSGPTGGAPERRERGRIPKEVEHLPGLREDFWQKSGPKGGQKNIGSAWLQVRGH